MFCGKCGANLKDSAKFCPICGAAQEKPIITMDMSDDIPDSEIQNPKPAARTVSKKASWTIILIVIAFVGIMAAMSGSLDPKNSLSSGTKEIVECMYNSRDVWMQTEYHGETKDYFTIRAKVYDDAIALTISYALTDMQFDGWNSSGETMSHVATTDKYFIATKSEVREVTNAELDNLTSGKTPSKSGLLAMGDIESLDDLEERFANLNRKK